MEEFEKFSLYDYSKYTTWNSCELKDCHNYDFELYKRIIETLLSYNGVASGKRNT